MSASWRLAERLFPWLAALMAFIFVLLGIDELFYQTGRRPHRLESVLWAFAISFLFGVSAASFWRRWRIRRPAAFVCGICLTVFTVSALREGDWDDASGMMAGGIMVFSGVTAILGLILGASGFSSVSPPDVALERTHEK